MVPDRSPRASTPPSGRKAMPEYSSGRRLSSSTRRAWIGPSFVSGSSFPDVQPAGVAEQVNPVGTREPPGPRSTGDRTGPKRGGPPRRDGGSAFASGGAPPAHRGDGVASPGGGAGGSSVPVEGGASIGCTRSGWPERQRNMSEERTRTMFCPSSERADRIRPRPRRARGPSSPSRAAARRCAGLPDPQPPLIVGDEPALGSNSRATRKRSRSRPARSRSGFRLDGSAGPACDRRAKRCIDSPRRDRT